MTVDSRIAKLEAEIEENQEKIRDLRAGQAATRVRDLETFEAMSTEERAELYHTNPDLFRHYMRIKADRNMRALFERKGAAGALSYSEGRGR